MIALNKVSRIRLGVYRMSLMNNKDVHTSHYAVKSGVNLIDTALNYENGNSELLIGRYLRENNDMDLFITKFGYAQDHPEINQMLLEKVISKSDLTVYGNTVHCIHPSFLLKKLEQSQFYLYDKQL